MKGKTSILPIIVFGILYLIVLCLMIYLSIYYNKRILVILLPLIFVVLPLLIHQFTEIEKAFTLKSGFFRFSMTKEIKVFIKGILIGALGMFALVFFNLSSGRIFISSSLNYYLVDYIRSQNPILLIGLFGIFIPVFEELLFRKMLLERLMNKGGALFAILVSSIIFALFNLIFPVYIGLLLGLLYSILYVFYKRIMINIIIHSAYHIILMLIVLDRMQFSRSVGIVLFIICSVSFVILSIKERKGHFDFKKVKKGREYLILMILLAVLVLIYKYLVNKIFLPPVDLFTSLIILYVGFSLVLMFFLKSKQKYLLVPLVLVVFIAGSVLMKDKVVIESRMNTKVSYDFGWTMEGGIVSLSVFSDDSPPSCERTDFYEIQDDLSFSYITSFNGVVSSEYKVGKINIYSRPFKYEIDIESGELSYLGKERGRWDFPYVRERANHTYHYYKDHIIIDKGKSNEAQFNKRKREYIVTSESGDHFVYVTEEREYVFYQADLTQVVKHKDLMRMITKAGRFWLSHDEDENTITVYDMSGVAQYSEKLPHEMKMVPFNSISSFPELTNDLLVGFSDNNLYMKVRSQWISFQMKCNDSPMIFVQNEHIFITQMPSSHCRYLYIYDPSKRKFLTKWEDTFLGPVFAVRINDKDYYLGRCFYSPKQSVLFSIEE
ncbi:CPBP family intramembrane metalloprotease [bacterium]|nr:CPBP family intramembrane metalloprotease [bacterium]